jgi:hypothetical protein
MCPDPGPRNQQGKRAMFDRLASHLTVLAEQVELAMLEQKSGMEK